MAVSTKADTDVCEYPDNGKFAVGTRDGFRFIGRADDALDYWDGEPDSAL